MQKKLRQRYLKWVLLIMSLLVAGLLIFKSRDGLEWITDLYNANKGGDLVKMTGIKNSPPEKLSSFQSISGMLDLQHWVTPAGVRVYFVSVPSLPMVDIELIFDAGAARNLNKGGLAYLTNHLLAEGTQDLSAEQVAESFDDVGAQFSTSSQRDMASIHLRSLSQATQLMPAVQTLAAILSKPIFPQEGFKREQQNMISSLKHQAQSPDKVATRAFFNGLYSQHPYKNWVLGDEIAVQALTVEDVKSFYQQYYVAQNCVVAIVGDLTAREADALAQLLTKDLAPGQKAPALPSVSNLKQAEFQRINYPSGQTHILMGQPGLKQGDPDFYALHVGSHILGGNAVSRIFETIRNQYGLAYSAYSFFQPMSELGPFILNCQTRTDQAEKARTQMEIVLKDFISQGPTEQELNEAKQNLIGGYALEFDNNLAICRQIAALGFYGLPLNHFNNFKPSVEKLTVAEIKAAFQNRISPDRFVTVMLGNMGDTAQTAQMPQLPQGSGDNGVSH